MSPKHAKQRSQHPGVLVIRPTAARPYYALRYTDPATGTSRQPRLDVASEHEAEQAALQLVEGLRAQRASSAAPTAAPAPRAPARVRPESKTKGVVIIKPRPGRSFYALRYTDPSTGRGREPRLPGVTTLEAAEAAAQTLSRTLLRRQLEVTLAGGREFAGTTCSIREEVSTYLAAVGRKVSRRGRRTSPITLRRYRDGLTEFADWCERRGVLQLGGLSRGLLADWLVSRQEKLAHGHAREPSSVNQEVKPIRQMLIAAAVAGRFVHLSGDALRGALGRLVQPAPKPRCYRTAEIKAIFEAAFAYDDSPKRKRSTPPMAPVVAVALLSGMRRGELATLQCHEVVFDHPSEYDEASTGLDVIRLPAAKTKTHEPRDVEMGTHTKEDGRVVPRYSPLLAELMRALTSGRKHGYERVLRTGYQAMGDKAKKLIKLGAPADFQMKDLRSTCATYQSPLPGNAKAKAARMGHTLAVADMHYLAIPGGTPTEAPDLETVMKCAEQVREVIRRVLQSKVVRS